MKIIILIISFTYSLFGEVIKLVPVSEGKISLTGFSLIDDTEIKIRGKVAKFEDMNGLYFYGWILNSKNREVVWNLYDDDLYNENEGIFEFESSLALEKGDYEFYSIGISNFISINFNLNQNNLGEFFKNLLRRNSDKMEHFDELFLEIEGKDIIQKSGFALADNYSENSIISFTRIGEDQYKEKIFEIKEDLPVRIYSIGEIRKDGAFDYAYIYDLKNRKRVWSMDYNNVELAGGGKKNSVFNSRINLEKGVYRLVYVSDDSHSYNDWNVFPPNDPQFWGITIFLENNKDKDKIFFLENDYRFKPVLEISRVGDDKYISKAFEVKKDINIVIGALGEKGFSNEMVDYAWITDAKSRKTIWQMEAWKTEYAGGSKKNRMLSENLLLEKGKYILNFVTDDSHSFEDWNSSPPYEPENWGVKIWLENNDDNKFFSEMEIEKVSNGNVLVEIIRVGEDEEISKDFKLEKDSRIRIISIGEGSDDEMYDFGWIEDRKSEKIVWELTYKMTEHAGGAAKNRYYNNIILLPKGEYTAFFETDDSHSFGDWNSSPPKNPELYGITIILEN